MNPSRSAGNAVSSGTYGGARLQHREQRDDHVDGPLDGDTDAVPGAHAGATRARASRRERATSPA